MGRLHSGKTGKYVKEGSSKSKSTTKKRQSGRGEKKDKPKVTMRMMKTKSGKDKMVMEGKGAKEFFGKVANAAKAVNRFAKDNKIVSKLKSASDSLGLTPLADRVTGGLASKIANSAIQMGYGPKGTKSVVVLRPMKMK